MTIADRKKGRTWWFLAIIIFIAIVLFSSKFFTTINTAIIRSNVSYSEKIAKETGTERIQKEEARQENIKELSSDFCTQRQFESDGSNFCYHCADLKDVIKSFDSNVSINEAKTSALKEDCDRVAELCLDKWGFDDCLKIAFHQNWIGMTEHQLVISFGAPDDINNTTSKWGKTSQWIYGEFPYVVLYIYLDNGVVTSWQD